MPTCAATLTPGQYTAPLATGLATLARIRQATGDAAGELDAIGEAERVAPSPAAAGLSNPLPAQRARLLLAQAATEGHAGSVIEICALQALAHEASRDEPAAMAALAEALTLACPQGYVRVFGDGGPSMGALLGRLVAAHRANQAPARRIPLSCLARLVQAFDGTLNVPSSGRSSAAAVPGLIEPLTGRELQVLAMLAVGAPNQAIAGELFITS